MQGSISSRLHERETGREALSLSTVESIVLLTLVYYILSCWDAVANGPLAIYCLTGLLFTQSECTYQKFRSPVVSAHMCAAPRVPTVQFVCKHGTEDALNKTNKYPVDLCICTPVYKFNMD